MRPFFSLIIPCHNSLFIKRLFDSLEKQAISKDDLQIIVVDDNSDDKSYIDVIKQYDFNVEFTETNVEIHCPSNTRRKGMELVKGRWLFFCDHDDYFVENSLYTVKDYIEKADKTIYVLSTNIIQCNEDGSEPILHERQDQWLHGKWYNVDEFIRKYNINFKQDLYTHEDCYFNSLALNALFSINEDYDYLDIVTYYWVNYKDSLSRREYTDRGYFYENFNNYLLSVTEPFFDNAIKTHDGRYIHQIMMGLLHGYLYFEAASYYYGCQGYKDKLEDIRTLLLRIINDLNIPCMQVIDYIYSNPQLYDKVKQNTYSLLGAFVPKTSFKDFVTKLLEEM